MTVFAIASSCLKLFELSELATKPFRKNEKSGVKAQRVKKGLKECEGELAKPIKGHVRNRDVMLSEALTMKCGVAVSRSTSDNYITAVKVFRTFLASRHESNGRIVSDDIPLKAFTVDLIGEFSTWLATVRGVSQNTSAAYLRCLHAVYFYAFNSRRIRRKVRIDPFCKADMHNVETIRPSLTAAEVRRLQKLRLPKGSTLSLVRDAMVFMFFACGMPFVDFARLTMQNIHGDILVYRRRKTGRLVRVKITPEMRVIISRLGGSGSGYLFGVIKHKGSAEQWRDIQSALRLCNVKLKTLAKLAGIDGALSTYSFRHSWATIADRNGAKLGTISQALGHASQRTTRIYIDGVTTSEIFFASDIVRNAVNSIHVSACRTIKKE